MRAGFPEDCTAEPVGGDTAAPTARELRIWRLLDAVPDPEIPVLSVVDLGIVREVRWQEGEALRVSITPTYTGCPATEVIRAAIVEALARAGYADAVVRTALSPPWSSDWLSDAGRRKLAAYGIAPPLRSRCAAPAETRCIACPHCGSHATRRLAEFGSTPCKAHYQCTACLEPFDYFKCY
jgi:ring-1,2-phenylacetyl-CoA epoxidase subunit PaaD